MAKSLVIVESPAKAKTINKYLGDDYLVASSVGHIRDLPKSSGQDLGFDEETWQARYEVLEGKKKVVSDLKKLSKSAPTIYLATDLDREGEAIAWHLREALGGPSERYRRVVFNEITRASIQKAFEDPRDLDMDRVNAQQTRRFLDRLVGFRISPLLWKKIARGLSAGRVQSVAVRMIVERERAIRLFVPEEYWEVDALLISTDGGRVRFSVWKQRGETFRPGSADEADRALEQLRQSHYSLESCVQKETAVRPSAPFVTSTLQQSASSRLGFSVRRTMSAAQKLYEAGHITYMRTDSTHLSGEAVQSARAWLEQNLGKDYVPAKPRAYSSRKSAQEAHEAIRPTDAGLEKVRGRDDEQKLYGLIRQRFLACQSSDARYLATTLIASAKDSEDPSDEPNYLLRARGRVMLFDGHTRLLKLESSADNPELPVLQEGELFKLGELLPEQKFTKPPPRYGEAALVKELEKRGIGRPSTYASIISTIQERAYVRLESKRFYSEKLGELVTDRLIKDFPNLMDYHFTADLEMGLDEVASGKRDWQAMLSEFNQGFQQQLQDSQESTERKPVLDIDYPCSECEGNMQVRFGRTGVFMGCSNFIQGNKEEGCKHTTNMQPLTDTQTDDDDGLVSVKRCPKCESHMDSWYLDEQRALLLCSNIPACDASEVIEGTYATQQSETYPCSRCTGSLQQLSGRFGPYFKCNQCDATRKVQGDGTPAPQRMDPIPMLNLKCTTCEDHYLLREGATGLFLAASGFPKNRETRTPKVSEILPVISQLPEAWQHYNTAPLEDPDGNETVIRFSRKANSSYVGSVNAKDKYTKWATWYANGVWADKPGNSS